MTNKTYSYCYQMSKWIGILFAWISYGYIVYGIFAGINKFCLLFVFVCSFLPYAIIHGFVVQVILEKYFDVEDISKGAKRKD